MTIPVLVFRASVIALAFAVQSACTPLRPAVTEARPPNPAPAVDVSYDWRVLVPAPLGTDFAALQAGLHEVLLFHDVAPGAAAADGLEADDCYRANAAGPRFVGRATTDFLWCFRHDRLERIAAVVRLPSVDAPTAFARYCAAWLEHAAEASLSPTHCAARDGAEAFSADLQGTESASATDLAIVVYQAGEH
jgi:hypothetical protein